MMSAARQNSSIHIFDHDEFVQYVCQQLTAHTRIPIIAHSGLNLTLRLAGEPVLINLEPLYHTYLQHPSSPDMAIAALLNAAEQGKPHQFVTDFNALRPFIYPMLKPLSFLVPVREQNLPMLVYQFFLADLIITYVIDEQNSVAYINEQHMTRWQIDLPTLHRVALNNLRQRTAHMSHTTVGEGEQRLFIFHSQDGYDATRLLLPEVLAPWQYMLPGRIVIGIPNRDFLVAFSDSNSLILTSIAQRIQLDNVQHAVGLTDQLFTLLNDEIHEYRWE